jgi:kynurenine formamidase
MQYTRLLIIAMLCILTTTLINAQTREEGPWWPHPLWGAEDQAGSSNWITPEVILKALEQVTTGKVYEIGQVYEAGMPLFGDRTYSMRSPGSPSGGPFGENSLIYNDDFLCTEIGQVGTQFDGPGHIGTRLRYQDGTIQDVYYNGYTGAEMYGPYGLKELGIENVKPIITRGILIDLAGLKGVDHLPEAYVVSLEDVLDALERQGMSPSDLRDGDAIFFRYGWSHFWDQPENYNKPAPGIGMEVARWVVERNPAMVGSDQSSTEVVKSEDPSTAFPIHQYLINQQGIWNLENLVFDALVEDQVYEFLFIFTPIRFKGATGSPGRPIAIR